MASQIQLLIVLLVLVAVIAVAGAALQSGVTIAPRFAGGAQSQGAQTVSESSESAQSTSEPIAVINVFPPQ